LGAGRFDLSTPEKFEAYQVWRDLPKHEWESALYEECVHAFVKYRLWLDEQRLERIESGTAVDGVAMDPIEWLAFLSRHPELSDDFYGLTEGGENV
jgi:hypothetical protein